MGGSGDGDGEADDDDMMDKLEHCLTLDDK